MATDGRHGWFWKKIGFWFIPVKLGKLGPEEWRKIRHLDGGGNKRYQRRIIVVLWFAILAANVRQAFHEVHVDGAGSFATVLLIVLPELMLVFMMLWIGRNNLAQIPLEERSEMEFGTEFEALKERQRADLFQRKVRDSILGRMPVDEHEAELRLRAQGKAYRLLRWLLPAGMIGYWMMSFVQRGKSSSQLLFETAIGVTWAVATVLAAPVLVRMWTQPDQPGEPSLAAQRREA